MVKKLIFIVSVFILSGNFLFCDKIYFKNGKTMEGKVVSYDNEFIEVEFSFGSIKFSSKDVKRYEKCKYDPKTNKSAVGSGKNRRHSSDKFKMYKDIPFYADLGYSKLEYEYYNISGQNFEEAYSNVSMVGPKIDENRAIATCSVKPRITFKISEENGVVKIKDVTISYTNKIMLPYWNVPENVDEQELYYWEAFLKEVWNHEYRHAQINNDGLSRIKNTIENIRINPDLGFGHVEIPKAQKKAEEEIRKIIDNIWKETMMLQEGFDKIERGTLFRKIDWAKPK
ncbi:MAG: DUF922 domain-containing protein [Elusimicrobiota bacterium]|nr:DUF922 domain-containing protein [Elusimicrobiota bacterium]